MFLAFSFLVLFMIRLAMNIEITVNVYDGSIHTINLPENDVTVFKLKQKLVPKVLKAQKYQIILNKNGVILNDDIKIHTSSSVILILDSFDKKVFIRKNRHLVAIPDQYITFNLKDNWTTTRLFKKIAQETRIRVQHQKVTTKLPNSDLSYCIESDHVIDFFDGTITLGLISFVIEGFYVDVTTQPWNINKIDDIENLYCQIEKRVNSLQRNGNGILSNQDYEYVFRLSTKWLHDDFRLIMFYENHSGQIRSIDIKSAFQFMRDISFSEKYIYVIVRANADKNAVIEYIKRNEKRILEWQEY